MNVKLLFLRTTYFKYLAILAFCAVFSTTSLASAADDLLSKIAGHNEEATEQCIKNVNKFAEDSLDTSTRIYQTGICHFCIDCDFAADNGQVFQIVKTSVSSNEIINLEENYATAHKLITQAAGLGNAEAYYGLAVLIYLTDLVNDKKSKVEISKSQIDLHKDSAISAQEEAQLSVESTLKKLYQKQHKSEFSQNIHKHLLVSAKQGYLPAQFALSEVYFRGVGVVPDDIQAYAWAATAVAQNPPFGSQRRDEKAVKLDNTKLNQAEAFAEDYMKKYTNIFDRSSITVMR